MILRFNGRMDMTDILDSITAAVAVVAVFVALWTALRSLKEQRLLAQRSVEEQRLLAHQQFLWQARSALYSRVLVFLHARNAEVAKLSTKIEERQNQADGADIDLLITGLTQSLDEHRSGQRLPTRPEPNVHQDAQVTRMDTVEIISRFTKLLELTPELQVDVALLASKNARKALGAYTGSVAFPDTEREHGVEALTDAFEFSRSAFERLTSELVNELQADPAGPRERSAP